MSKLVRRGAAIRQVVALMVLASCAHADRPSGACAGPVLSECHDPPSCGVLGEDLLNQEHPSPEDNRRAATVLQRACDGKNYEGCYNLGWAIENGVGLARDSTRALQLFQLACYHGIAAGCEWLVKRAHDAHDESTAVRIAQGICTPTVSVGCNDLGLALLDGAGIPKDVPESVRKFAQACDGGEDQGCLNFAGSLVHARGVAQDYPYALSIYTDLCDDDVAAACEDEGELVRDGQGTEASPEEAQLLFLQACNMDNANGCAQLGSSLRASKLEPVLTLPLVLTAFSRACELGQAHACNIAGLMAINGEAGKADPTAGVEMLESGCVGRHCADAWAAGCSAERKRDACHDLGWALWHGPGVSHDVRRAELIFRRTCDEGLAPACEQLGWMYLSGEGAEGKSVEKALGFLNRACEAKDWNACNNLGELYRKGADVKKDLPHALRIYRAICEQHFQLGCANLGELWRDGQGVKRDVREAMRLFQNACNGGEGSGCDDLGQAFAKQAGRTSARDAAELYQKACDLGVADGCRHLAKLLTVGRGMARDPARARLLLEKAKALPE